MVLARRQGGLPLSGRRTAQTGGGARRLPYEKAFTGRAVGASARTELGLAHYERTLAPGRDHDAGLQDAPFPGGAEGHRLSRRRQGRRLRRLPRQDRRLLGKALGRFSRIHTPGEPLIEQAHRATAVHVMLATHT